MKVIYWSDYNCPYCYIAYTRLNKAINEMDLDVDFEIHSFELDPSAPKDVQSTTLERFAQKYNISLHEAEREINNIAQVGQEEGIDFNYKTTLFTNSFDAHRLVKFTLTKNSSVVEKLHELLFKAYFVDNKKLADKNVLLDIAGQVGMDLDEVNEMLDGDEYKDEVLLDEKTAYQLGIHAVPYFIFENKYVVPGALSTDDFKNVLSKVLTEEETETSDAKQCTNGVCDL